MLSVRCDQHCMLYLQSNLPVLDPESSDSHLRPFGCKCFVLKHGNLKKFEFDSSNGILLEYTPHGTSYRVFNLETNIIVKSCDVTFDESAPCPHDVFECVGDKEMEESIFVDEEL
jgi:hypothetical protein